MSKLKLVDWLILAALSGLLFFSAVDKLAHYSGFLNALRDYVLVPRGTAELLAMPVILLEIFLAVTMWMPRFRRVSLWATGGLFVLFAAMIGANLLWGARGACGCWFSLTLASSDEMHIVQDLILAFMAFMVASDVVPQSAEPFENSLAKP